MKNIKVSIKIEGIAKNTVIMSEENAKDAYVAINRTLAQFLDKGLRAATPTRREDTPPQRHDLQVEVNGDVAKKALEGALDSLKAPLKPKQKELESNKDSNRDGRKTLIAFRCEDCGKVGFAVLAEGEVAICRECENAILLGDLVPVYAKCPNCGHAYNFKVKGDWMDFYKCKKCESPIDLEMHKKERKLVSMDARG
ncbi:hypothetical protein EUAN_12530 [Andreesenia angusta]|uniref:Uncharacterized protein n=1 Tax=Andreesenia angusta TaxID=39480 RepID=A0A1S1V6Q3_9FIRM|nr:hypothetical protein [Andreesenia angusta]OHW62184.1 hypothetical protein EUAN_12530 [Andreesenia angusta]